MSNSDSRFGYTAKLSRTDHDLSRPFGFTCAPGMLLPIHADIVSPGDTLYVKHDLPFMRTNPLAAPAMVDIKVHFETFFVPFQLIYQPAENTLTSINQQYSNFYTYTDFMNNRFPYFDYSGYISDLKINHPHDDIRAQAFRLADMLGLNAENFCDWHDAPDGGETPAQPWISYAPNFFPWQILTYKSIFEHFYRLDDKTQFTSSECNWDSYYSTTTPILPSASFMMIYRRPWNFDYFTSSYWSPIVSSANLQSVLPNSAYSDLLPRGVTPLNDSGTSPLHNSDIRSFVSGLGTPYDYANANSSVSTAMVRQMFANEKLAMITGRARKNYDSQILAHYGVNVPHDVKHELSLIGHDEYDLRIGEVTSLASTNDAPLGELAGKGWASSREEGKMPRQHKFTAPVHGVVMTIFSVEPLRRYFGGFEMQNNVFDAFDLPVPEFDRLGNQPLFRFSIGQLANSSQSATDIVAWKERYYQWKRRSPKCTLAFQSGNRGQGQNNYEAYMLGSRPFAELSAFDVWSGISTTLKSDPSNENRFYIPFNCLDGIMLEKYGYGFAAFKDADHEDWDWNPHLVYIRDPFIVDCYPTVKKVSWMSKDGEPIYPY